MEQTSGTNPVDAEAPPAPQDTQGAPAPDQPPAPGAEEAGPAPAAADGASPEPDAEGQPGFRSRGRARRRARFLRRARELAYRDLGGLVYNLHRFGQRNDALVLAKLSTLGHIDDELRAIERALAERRPVTVLREAGITACPRCAAIHASEDRFCPNCGLPMSRHADLPVAGAASVDPGVGAPSAPGTVAPHGAPSPQAPAQPPAGVPAPAQPSQTAASPYPAHPPATAQHRATQPPTPSAGRSPTPPPRSSTETQREQSVADSSQPARGATPEEPTEIIRPSAPQS